MPTPETPQVRQAADLLCSLFTDLTPEASTLDALETHVYNLVFAVGHALLRDLLPTVIAAAEAVPPRCVCGAVCRPEQRRSRDLLGLFGLLRCRLRRYRCPSCRAWTCPAAQRLGCAPRSRLTPALHARAVELALAWSYAAAAQQLSRWLPRVTLSAKTLERHVRAAATPVQTAEDRAAAAALDPLAPLPGRPETPAGAAAAPPGVGPRFAAGARVYVALDGILVRGRAAERWLEVQVGTLWSPWQTRGPQRQTPRREITDRIVVARATGWESLGEPVWRVFSARGGAEEPEREVVVLGDGAAGIRSLWELHFPTARVLLDPWPRWEKVKTRARQVWRRREAAWTAAQEVYAVLRRGAVAEAQELVRGWKPRGVAGAPWQERLLAYLERNADGIADYDALRAAGYLTGSGLTEKANELVVALRLKNGKMHWSRAGANAVALLRARHLNQLAHPSLPM